MTTGRPVHRLSATYGRTLRVDPRLRYVLIFKNFGAAAGASIPHTHSQIIATPVVPANVQNEVHHSREYQSKFNQCVFCSPIDEALTYEATIYDRESGQFRRKVNLGRYVVERGEHPDRLRAVIWTFCHHGEPGTRRRVTSRC